jgi:hypothetical protein
MWPTDDSFDFDDDDVGGAWGHLHERSALATYLTGFLLPRCPSACLHETGYWPLSGLKERCSIELGASPDALIEGADGVYPGGVTLEVKCPFRQGAPRAQPTVFARQVPQLQGALLATGRETAHLVSWAPSGCAVFELQRDAAYQQMLLEYLVAFAACASEQRPPGRAESQHASAVRAQSKLVARRAIKVGDIAASDCVALLHE